MWITTSYVFHRSRNLVREAQEIHRYNLGKSEILRTFLKLNDVT